MGEDTETEEDEESQKKTPMEIMESLKKSLKARWDCEKLTQREWQSLKPKQLRANKTWKLPPLRLECDMGAEPASDSADWEMGKADARPDPYGRQRAAAREAMSAHTSLRSPKDSLRLESLKAKFDSLGPLVEALEHNEHKRRPRDRRIIRNDTSQLMLPHEDEIAAAEESDPEKPAMNPSPPESYALGWQLPSLSKTSTRQVP